MNKLNSLKLSGILLVCTLFIFGCAAKVTTSNSTVSDDPTQSAPNKSQAAKKVEAYSPVGVWEYTVDTPDGGSTGTMRVKGAPGTYDVVLETDQYGSIRVDGIQMVGRSMTGSIDVAGNAADLEIDFDEENFSGVVVMGDQVFPLDGTRTSK